MPHVSERERSDDSLQDSRLWRGEWDLPVMLFLHQAGTPCPWLRDRKLALLKCGEKVGPTPHLRSRGLLVGGGAFKRWAKSQCPGPGGL